MDGYPSDRLFLSLVLFFGGSLISLPLLLVLPAEKLFGILTDSKSVIEFLSFYCYFIGIWILFILMCGLFRGNRPILRQIAPNKNGNTLKGGLIGLLLGVGTNGLCILLSVLMGDIRLCCHEFRLSLLLAFLITVFIQCGAEELVTRVYLYQKLRRRYRNPAVAIVGNAVFFSALHLPNPGVGVLPLLNILAAGAVFSVMVYYYDSVWAAIMMHTG